MTERSASPIALGPLLRTFGPLVGLVFVWGLFAVLKGDTFMQWSNQRLMLLQTAVVGTAAIGATLIIIAGGIDLSVGSTIALGTVVVALLLNAGVPPVLAAGGGVLTGMLCGLAIGAMVIGHVGRVAALIAGGLATGLLWSRWGAAPAIGVGVVVLGGLLVVNEWLVKRLPLAPFIVTLGMWGALRGAAKGLGDNQPVYPDDLGMIASLMQPASSGIGSFLPLGVLVLIGLAVVIAATLHFTRFGRHVYAIGSSPLTARLCGIHVERTTLLIYVLGIGCAGIAAVLQLSYLSMGDPTTAEGYELKVIAAVVIGGASLSGGEGSIRGTIIGALIMTVVDNGCTQLRLDNWVQEVVTGGIIVAAVALDRARHRTST